MVLPYASRFLRLLTFWFPGSKVSVPMDSHPLFFPDLFELIEHASLTAGGDEKKACALKKVRMMLETLELLRCRSPD